MPRLLVCMNDACKTIEELPIFSGPPNEEAHDPLLERLVHRHTQRHGNEKADAFLLMVSDEDWETPQKKDMIIKGLKDRHTGFEPELYAIKNTFQEDALKCYSAHRRPQDGCIDYHDSSKLLTPDSWITEEETMLDRSDLTTVKQQATESRKAVYLCDFCPAQSLVTTLSRYSKGMYE